MAQNNLGNIVQASIVWGKCLDSCRIHTHSKHFSLSTMLYCVRRCSRPAPPLSGGTDARGPLPCSHAPRRAFRSLPQDRLQAFFLPPTHRSHTPREVHTRTRSAFHTTHCSTTASARGICAVSLLAIGRLDRQHEHLAVRYAFTLAAGQAGRGTAVAAQFQRACVSVGCCCHLLLHIILDIHCWTPRLPRPYQCALANVEGPRSRSAGPGRACDDLESPRPERQWSHAAHVSGNRAHGVL